MVDDPRYPIGKYVAPELITSDTRGEWIGRIATLPRRLRDAVAGMNDEQLDTPYREGGWTVRQVVHHLVDSHIHSYIRFKWTLTEEMPTAKGYDEKAWADLPDGARAPAEVSLDLLDSLHRRWVVLLESLSDEEYGRTYVHPRTGKELSLAWTLGLYAWHGDHHLGHIEGLKKARGW